MYEQKQKIKFIITKKVRKTYIDGTHATPVGNVKRATRVSSQAPSSSLFGATGTFFAFCEKISYFLSGQNLFGVFGA